MGRGKNGLGNRELKELVCTTHMNKVGGCWRVGGEGQRGDKGGNWEHCNSIINKITLKRKKIWLYLTKYKLPDSFASLIPLVCVHLKRNIHT